MLEQCSPWLPVMKNRLQSQDLQVQFPDPRAYRPFCSHQRSMPLPPRMRLPHLLSWMHSSSHYQEAIFPSPQLFWKLSQKFRTVITCKKSTYTDLAYRISNYSKCTLYNKNRIGSCWNTLWLYHWKSNDKKNKTSSSGGVLVFCKCDNSCNSVRNSSVRAIQLILEHRRRKNDPPTTFTACRCHACVRINRVLLFFKYSGMNSKCQQ